MLLFGNDSRTAVLLGAPHKYVWKLGCVFFSSCGSIGLALQTAPFSLHTTVLPYAIPIHAGALRRLFLQEADSQGREEWMIVPPKSLGVLGALKTLNPTNRKFQT